MIKVEAKSKQGYSRKAYESIVEAFSLEGVEDSKYFEYVIFHYMVNKK